MRIGVFRKRIVRWLIRRLGVARWKPIPPVRLLWKLLARIDWMSSEQRQILQLHAEAALRFASPIYFGVVGRPKSVRSGTVTLLELDGKRLGITNFHVLQEYRRRLHRIPCLLCQVGDVVIEPNNLVISESPKYDLVVMDFSAVDPSDLRTGGIQHSYHVPRQWPPEELQVGQFVMFGGYPAAKRRFLESNRVEFGGVSSAGSEVISVQPDVLSFQIQIEQCVVAYDKDGVGFEDLPGISGSPVLVSRLTDGGIEVIDLVGIFFEDRADLDVYRARRCDLIQVDGHIAD